MEEKQIEELYRFRDKLNGFSELTSKNELSIALIGASMLDKAYYDLLIKYFTKSSTSERILKSDKGLLGSLRSKADLAYALGLISKDVLKNTISIMEIRNIFGHNHVKTSFADKDIDDLCNEFSFKNIEKNKIASSEIQMGDTIEEHDNIMIYRGLVFELMMIVDHKAENIEKCIYQDTFVIK